MTTVTIGSYHSSAQPPDSGQARPILPGAEPTRSERLSPTAEKREAFAPAQKEKSHGAQEREVFSEPNETEAPDGAEEREVRVFSAPDSVRRRLSLRAVGFVRFLLAAGAGLFVWLGGTFGSAELRAAIAEAVQRVLNG